MRANPRFRTRFSSALASRKFRETLVVATVTALIVGSVVAVSFAVPVRPTADHPISTKLVGPIPGSTTNQVASDTSSQSAKRHTRPPRGNSDFERVLGSCWDAIKIHAGKAAVKKLLAREFPGITDAVGDIEFANDAVNIVYETQSGELIQVPFDFSKFVYSMLEDVGGKTKNPVLELTGLIGQPATDCLQAALWLTQQAGKKWGVSSARGSTLVRRVRSVTVAGPVSSRPVPPVRPERATALAEPPRAPTIKSATATACANARPVPPVRLERATALAEPPRAPTIKSATATAFANARPAQTDRPETATVSSRPVPSIRCAITAVSANSRLAPTDRSAATTTTASSRLARLDRSETATVSVSSPPARPDKSATAAVSANSRLAPTDRSATATTTVGFRRVRRGRSVAAMVCVGFRRVRRGRSVAA